jgi:uncharacterized protein YdeI (YjbR/CyaY-like superfamily)
LDTLSFETRADWSAWLEANHADSEGIWLRIAKTNSGIPSVTYAEALEEALRYGWIDGQKRSLDESAWLQRFTPRGERSAWSKVNREKAEELMRSGRMQPAGLQAVVRARQNGRWEAAYDSAGRAAVPEDLQAALDAHPAAKAFFATLNSQNRYAILYRLQTAKKPETRAKRLAQYIGMLERKEKLYP